MVRLALRVERSARELRRAAEEARNLRHSSHKEPSCHPRGTKRDCPRTWSPAASRRRVCQREPSHFPFCFEQRGRLDVQGAPRRLAWKRITLPGVLIAIAAGRHHVTLEDEGLTRSNDHGRKHANLVFQ